MTRGASVPPPWPPPDVRSYCASAPFRGHIADLSKRLKRDSPLWAEDAVFDCVTDLLTEGIGRPDRLSDFPTEAAFRSYLGRCCRHRLIDYLRRGRPPRGAAALAVVGEADERPLPLDALVRDEMLRRIDRMVRGDTSLQMKRPLTEGERSVIRSYFHEERPQTDIAESMGVTPARVSQLVRSALEKLDEALFPPDAGPMPPQEPAPEPPRP